MHDDLIDIVRQASAEILDVYQSDFEVETKQDSSPLTQADLRAHRVIVQGLSDLDSDIPIISEESELPPYDLRRTWSRYWLVDPLDGTKEFVNRNDEFTVNIALIEANRAILGVVGVPVRGQVYVGDLRDGRAYRLDDQGRHTLATRSLPEDSITVVASRSHGGERLEEYLDRLRMSFGEVHRTHLGSSLKLCILADGLADFYPRLGPTSEWDIGAAQAVLEAAGGRVMLFDGGPLLHNSKESFLNPEFMAVADTSVDWVERLPEVPEP
ncbi:MAG: 3'(2'),5'-bisphosphate nucleotidase CysQ [Gammaproteobacteria bacterium]|nr:3'(2'),5'-bisphosphate nucleotidase CysQ [Gammaproteobacteria bacterium]